jgi:ABC-type lipopolysaccharide export system ATPase subunit
MISRAHVIDKGRIRFDGAIDELEVNEEVKKKYLMV